MTPKKKALLERCIEDGLRAASDQIKDSKTHPDSRVADDLRFDAIISELEDAFNFDNEISIVLSEQV
jgi:hypothetical protein